MTKQDWRKAGKVTLMLAVTMAATYGLVSLISFWGILPAMTMAWFNGRAYGYYSDEYGW